MTLRQDITKWVKYNRGSVRQCIKCNRALWHTIAFCAPCCTQFHKEFEHFYGPKYAMSPELLAARLEFDQISAELIWDKCQ
jgi:hypothetical protein